MTTSAAPASPATGNPAIGVGLRAATGLALLALGITVGMAPGARHLVGVWASSPTYHHGALVPLVSAFLIWTGWRAGDRPAGWPAALAGVALAALIYVGGTLADAQLVQHLGVALALVTGTAAILGPGLARRHRFALGFLLLAVPFGEGAVPALQQVTAGGIVLIAEAANLPVLREGLTILTPAGAFEVEEECAGLRFLIATVAVGVLCAHLFFTSPRKQAVMVLCAVALPVIANVARAAATVLIASATDMRVAAGVDHVVYGWGFFAVVLAVVIALALRWADEGAPRLPDPAPEDHAPRPLLWGGLAGLLCATPAVL